MSSSVILPACIDSSVNSDNGSIDLENLDLHSETSTIKIPKYRLELVTTSSLKLIVSLDPDLSKKYSANFLPSSVWAKMWECIWFSPSLSVSFLLSTKNLANKFWFSWFCFSEYHSAKPGTPFITA